MGIFDWKHWIVILIVVVLVFGTKKLKGLGSDVGESIKGFRKAMSDEETDIQTPAQSHQTLNSAPPHQDERNGCPEKSTLDTEDNKAPHLR